MPRNLMHFMLFLRSVQGSLSASKLDMFIPEYMASPLHDMSTSKEFIKSHQIVQYSKEKKKGKTRNYLRVPLAGRPRPRFEGVVGDFGDVLITPLPLFRG
jgi:hypothetical protein